MKFAAGIALSVLAGCSAGENQAALQQAQIERAKDPVGRYQLAGKRDFPNGTAIYCLDTTTGRVSYAWFSVDGKEFDPNCAAP